MTFEMHDGPNQMDLAYFWSDPLTYFLSFPTECQVLRITLKLCGEQRPLCETMWNHHITPNFCECNVTGQLNTLEWRHELPSSWAHKWQRVSNAIFPTKSCCIGHSYRYRWLWDLNFCSLEMKSRGAKLNLANVKWAGPKSSVYLPNNTSATVTVFIKCVILKAQIEDVSPPNQMDRRHFITKKTPNTFSKLCSTYIIFKWNSVLFA